MKICNPQMLTILYAPAQYTDQSHIPDAVRAVAAGDPILVNHWLLSNYQLQDLPEYDGSAFSSTLSMILAAWCRLATIAHLAGGYLLRDRLLSHGALLMSDTRLLAFISLPLFHQITMQNPGPEMDTVAFGAAFILALLADVPQGLRQRFMLLFPVNMNLPSLKAAATPDNMTLLRMAINYANDYHH